MASSNPFLLAADNSPALLPLLRESPALASAQDEHGYSLVHAAASYNHLDLLRTLIQEFKVDVNIKDEDNETALFVVETPEAAKALVELGVDVMHRGVDVMHRGVDVMHRGVEGFTAREKIEGEAEFPDVAAYLATVESERAGEELEATAAEIARNAPEGMKVTVGTMDETQDIPAEFDPEFRRRIEELAQREDFNTAEGQADLRKLVEEALVDQGLSEERNVRSKQA
ncbi:hypothetical protein MKX08_000271 [Trichoderma sp. CBMAI-0020]|nr:hypothetical protein MKX08_000271 [Trichoderma sp. CBMAI-0020]